ncbi:hypothetical protein B0H66DRAFT_536698 [Apodospora peruviana]|uniref:Homeobox domain-containing protein n=1 Tax=Apodospora peruviana TaxID=516989 RepID=A0AAE0HWV0_9PEZI|nr:hypothetical protein B0H66DRAFT_536698 [Apodospora peruviana]
MCQSISPKGSLFPHNLLTISVRSKHLQTSPPVPTCMRAHTDEDCKISQASMTHPIYRYDRPWEGRQPDYLSSKPRSEPAWEESRQSDCLPSRARGEPALDESRQFDYVSSRPPGEPERRELPSIRAALGPELFDPRLSQENNSSRPPSSSTSPVGLASSAELRSPHYYYTHSTNQNKRRRLSIGEEREEAAVPRQYNNGIPRELQMSAAHGPMSPTMPPRPAAAESWTSHSRTSPSYVTQSGNLPPIRREPAAPVEVNLERHEPQHNFPRSHVSVFERGAAHLPRIRGRSTDDTYPESSGQIAVQRTGRSATEPGMNGQPYPHNTYSTYGHPSRTQSLSLPSINPFDRTHPASGGYGFPYPFNHVDPYMRELQESMNPDNKQRKRRGNLPKETTDKLRTWFVAHLQHPYPTEDEKQELMRQTGLAMNQISNWFINARRRQLPAMMKDARAESDAMTSARGGGGSDGGGKSTTAKAAIDLTATDRAPICHDMIKREAYEIPLPRSPSGD